MVSVAIFGTYLLAKPIRSRSPAACFPAGQGSADAAGDLGVMLAAGAMSLTAFFLVAKSLQRIPSELVSEMASWQSRKKSGRQS